MKETIVSFKETLESFLQSDDFSNGVVASTKAGWGGSGYSVELFPDGHWRVLWDNEIGNLYDSPGIILSLPKLEDDDYDKLVNGDNPMDEGEWFYLQFSCEEDDLVKSMRDSLTSIEQHSAEYMEG